MAHQCERSACAEPAAVAYGFDPARGLAWLEALADGEPLDPRHGRLCRRHADAMVVPQGWWLEDRRSAEQLFAAPSTLGERAPRRPWRSSRPLGEVVPLPLPLVEPASPTPTLDADEAPAPTLTAVPAWTPAFVADDDLDGLLNATSPLLGRAFGQVKGSGTRARPPGA